MITYWKYVVMLMLALVITSCLKDEPFKNSYEGFQPASRNDGWIISTPEDEGMDRPLIDEAFQLVYNDTRFTMARSLQIIMNGKLIAEAYPHDKTDIDRIANIQSMTKSYTSILAGIALKQHILDSVDQTFFSIYPEWFSNNPEKKNITLKHAITMTTGIDFDNNENTQTLYQTTANSIEYVLSLPGNYEPGMSFHYHDGAPHLVSAAIQKQFGRPFSEFADQHLFSAARNYRLEMGSSP